MQESLMQYKPFVKWVGGKRELVDFIMPCIPKQFNNYFEPFVGGGALFYALLNKGLLDSKQIYLNDKNKELINAYKMIQNNPYKLLDELKILQDSHNKEVFYRIRNLDRQKDFKDLNPYFRAARFIYLNKTCFNGLCRYNSKGEFNTPMGSYKNPKIYDEALILQTHKILNNICIDNVDFEELIKNAISGDFIYFDPPYYPISETSSFVSYTDNFLQDEQMRLYEVFKQLDSRGVKVLQSNSSADFIRELYSDFEIIELKAKRVINCKGDKRGEIVEFLIKGNYK